MNNSRENNINNIFVVTVLFLLIVVSGFYIASLITSTMKTSNYSRVIIEEAKAGKFRPILGTAEYYFEIDRIISEDKPNFSIYGQYYVIDGVEEYYYSLIFYNISSSNRESGIGEVSFVCNDNQISRSFTKKEEQEYVSIMYSINELTDECGTDDISISEIKYILNSNVIMAIPNEYDLDLTKSFYIDYGTIGLSESEFDQMMKGTNIVIFRIVFYSSFSIILVVIGYKTHQFK